MQLPTGCSGARETVHVYSTVTKEVNLRCPQILHSGISKVKLSLLVQLELAFGKKST